MYYLFKQLLYSNQMDNQDDKLIESLNTGKVSKNAKIENVSSFQSIGLSNTLYTSMNLMSPQKSTNAKRMEFFSSNSESRQRAFDSQFFLEQAKKKIEQESPLMSE